MILLTTTINLIILHELVFMKNRLELAKRLLRDDGVIFVQCDDNEQAYLKVLMDEYFWIKIIIMVTILIKLYTKFIIIKLSILIII
nr:DNA methyltransferase [Mycoplasmopsis bovis]